MRRVLFCMALGVIATAVMAHDGVKNPAVMARMQGMKAIGAEVKVLGDMAKGNATFDVAAAKMALEAVARHAADTPALFEAREEDPKSEALPVIWSEFDDFTAKARELESIALNAAAAFDDENDLRSVLQRLGENCKSCHSVYRQ